ncbi:hypothetical protein V8F20_007483 [Naviculisporaceae sp. PSN 640]
MLSKQASKSMTLESRFLSSASFLSYRGSTSTRCKQHATQSPVIVQASPFRWLLSHECAPVFLRELVRIFSMEPQGCWHKILEAPCCPTGHKWQAGSIACGSGCGLVGSLCMVGPSTGQFSIVDYFPSLHCTKACFLCFNASTDDQKSEEKSRLWVPSISVAAFRFFADNYTALYIAFFPLLCGYLEPRLTRDHHRWIPSPHSTLRIDKPEDGRRNLSQQAGLPFPSVLPFPNLHVQPRKSKLVLLDFCCP